jgi:hypothetical protein
LQALKLQGSIATMNALRQILAPESRHFRRRGYQVFRRAFPPGQISLIADMARRLIPPYAGELRRQDGNFAVNEFFPGTQLVKNSLLHPHLPLPGDLESLSSALRALVTSPALADRLGLLDGVDHYIIHQTLLFFAAQTTDLHLDSWSVDTSPRGHTHTIWIPLQDLDHRSGAPSVIPWPRGKVVTEAELGLPEVGGRDGRYVRYHQALRDRLHANSPEAVLPLLRMGDFIVWASLTPHFTLPAQSFPAERLSLQVLIRPADNRWGDFLDQPYDRTSVELQRVTDRFSVRIVT